MTETRVRVTHRYREQAEAEKEERRAGSVGGRHESRPLRDDRQDADGSREQQNRVDEVGAPKVELTGCIAVLLSGVHNRVSVQNTVPNAY